MDISHAAEILPLEPLDIEQAIEAAEVGPFGERPTLPQFLRFGVVGCLGFVWDTSTVYMTRGALGLLPAMMAGFVVAATLNWVCNRIWTFRRAPGDGHLVRQWALYMVANSMGFVLNRGTASGLVIAFAACRAQPVLALAAGAGVGLAANFILSQRFVFKSKQG